MSVEKPLTSTKNKKEQKKDADYLISRIEQFNDPELIPDVLRQESKIIAGLDESEKNKVKDYIKRQTKDLLIETNIGGAQRVIEYLSGLNNKEKEEALRLSNLKNPTEYDKNDLDLLKKKEAIAQKLGLNQEEVKRILSETIATLKGGKSLDHLAYIIKNQMFLKTFDSILEDYFSKTEEIVNTPETPQQELITRYKNLSEIATALFKISKINGDKEALRLATTIDEELKKMEKLSGVSLEQPIYLDLLKKKGISQELSSNQLEYIIKNPMLLGTFDSVLKDYFSETEDLVEKSDTPQQILIDRRKNLSRMMNDLNSIFAIKGNKEAKRLATTIDDEMKNMEKLSGELDLKGIHA